MSWVSSTPSAGKSSMQCCWLVSDNWVESVLELHVVRWNTLSLFHGNKNGTAVLFNTRLAAWGSFHCNHLQWNVLNILLCSYWLWNQNKDPVEYLQSIAVPLPLIFFQNTLERMKWNVRQSKMCSFCVCCRRIVIQRHTAIVTMPQFITTRLLWTPLLTGDKTTQACASNSLISPSILPSPYAIVISLRNQLHLIRIGKK